MNSKRIASEEGISDLKYETVNINMGNIKGTPSIIYNDDGNILLAFNHHSKHLFADVSFNPLKIYKEAQESTFMANVVHLRNESSSKKNRSIPAWLAGFKQLKTLRLEEVDLDHLSILKDIPIHNLILSKVGVKNMATVLQDIVAHKELKNLVDGYGFTTEELAHLKQAFPQLNIMLESDYKAMAKTGSTAFVKEWL